MKGIVAAERPFVRRSHKIEEVPQILPNPPQTILFPETNPAPGAGLNAIRVLRFWHLTSLDAPTVAVVWSLALAWAAHLRLPAWAPLSLALAAWSVYIGDRLLDARAGLRTPPLHNLRDRHHFHWKHRWVLGFLAVVAAAASVGMIAALLPAGARAPDSVVAGATLAYFSGVHARRPLPSLLARFVAPFLTREFLVGILFTAGCLLPAWSRIGQAAHASQLRPFFIMTGCLALAAWLNCYAISRWESSATRSGAVKSRVSGAALRVAFLCGSIALALLSTAPRCGALCAAAGISACLLAALDHFRHRVASITLRAAADLALLTPALLLLLRAGA